MRTIGLGLLVLVTAPIWIPLVLIVVGVRIGGGLGDSMSESLGFRLEGRGK
jgi:hypothetical protein